MNTLYLFIRVVNHTTSIFNKLNIRGISINYSFSLLLPSQTVFSTFLFLDGNIYLLETTPIHFLKTLIIYSCVSIMHTIF